MKRDAMVLALMLPAAFCPAPGQQSAPVNAVVPAAKLYSGCVAQSAYIKTVYLLSTGDRCVKLVGGFDPSAVANHQVTFKGVLNEATGDKPATLNIQSTKEVGGSCKRTCSILNSGSRGLPQPAAPSPSHGAEKAGTIGGTPGVVTPPNP